MIKSKPCTVEGCNRPRFSHGLCMYHQKPRILKVGQRKIKYTIRRYSPEREEKNKLYHLACLEADIKYSRDGETYCYFCLEPTGPIKDHHHVAGRTGPNLLKGIVPSHRDCHTGPNGFHNTSLEALVRKPYFERYMLLLKETDLGKFSILMGKIMPYYTLPKVMYL